MGILNVFITCSCEAGTHIEAAEPDPSQSSLAVECLTTVGEYDIPAQWPNCTRTVLCGQPPAAPLNGTRTWLAGVQGGTEEYNTR